MLRVLFVLIALLPICNFAQNYEGKIGKYPIFMQLDIDYDDERVTGFYFYKSQLQNINLDGRKENNKIIAYLRYKEEKDKVELFTLQKSEDKLSGTWQHNDKTLYVELTKINQNAQQYKKQKFEFTRDSIVTFKNKQLVWFTEKYSKRILFRLGNGFTQKQRAFLNSKLDSIHYYYAETELECGVDALDPYVTLVSNNYISFSETYSLYCGGAHPNHGRSGYNYDIKNLVELDNINKVFPNLDYYNKIKSKYKDDTGLQDECEYFEEFNNSYWEYATWFLTEKGITIIPEYPHALTPCEEEFELTYEEIKKQ